MTRCAREYRGHQCGLPAGHPYAHHTREGEVGDVSWANVEAGPSVVSPSAREIFEAGWNAGFREAETPDVWPERNRCEDAFQEWRGADPGVRPDAPEGK